MFIALKVLILYVYGDCFSTIAMLISKRMLKFFSVLCLCCVYGAVSMVVCLWWCVYGGAPMVGLADHRNAITIILTCAQHCRLEKIKDTGLLLKKTLP